MEREHIMEEWCRTRTLTTGRGWQGKSAAFGRAHVVGGVEVLRAFGNHQAIAPFQIVKEINAARAVGLRKFAVRLS
jgi:hypothetical protein